MRVEGMTYPVNSRPAGPEQLSKQAVRESDYSAGDRREKGTPNREALQDGALPSRRGPGQLKAEQSLLERQRSELARRLLFLNDKPENEQDDRLLDKLNGAIREMNESMEVKHLSLRFELHEDSERWMVQIVDIVEDQVIREIPPEKMLQLSARIQDTVGVMLDRQS